MNSKTKNIIGWILTVILVLAFLMAGATKIAGQEEMVQNFEKWGISVELMYFIGMAEMLGAVGLFIPKMRFLAILGLVGVMLGAIATHILSGEQFIPPLVLLLLLIALGWIKKPVIINS